MCEVLQNSYKTIAGKKVDVKPYISLDDIPESVRKELEKSNATQLDLLLVRSGLAENKAETKKLKSLAISNRDKIEELNQKFYVDVPNGGESKETHISELILDMYNRETNRRHLSYFWALLSRHKILVYFIIGGFFLLNVGFHNYIRDMFHWIAENFIDLLKIIF